MLRNNEFAKEAVDKQEIAKLAKFKRERSKKSFADLKQQQLNPISAVSLNISASRVSTVYAKDFLTQKPPLLS